MKGKDTLLLLSITFICLSIGLLSEVFNSNDLFYELGWGDLQRTKAYFQDFELKEINNYSKTGNRKTYEAILKVITSENKSVGIKVDINLMQYMILKDKEKFNNTEDQFDSLTLDYYRNAMGFEPIDTTVSREISEAEKKTKALRHTKKGDTLLIHHSGNITFPYTVQNITPKSMLVEKQGGNRLNGNLLILSVSVLMLLASLSFLYAISKSKQNNKPTIQQNNKPTK